VTVGLATGILLPEMGVPLAFLMFSAPFQNQKTCTRYNTEILTKLLEEWKHSLGKHNGKVFKAYVAITDTDLMECGALVLVFPRFGCLSVILIYVSPGAITGTRY